MTYMFRYVSDTVHIARMATSSCGGQSLGFDYVACLCFPTRCRRTSAWLKWHPTKHARPSQHLHVVHNLVTCFPQHPFKFTILSALIAGHNDICENKTRLPKTTPKTQVSYSEYPSVILNVWIVNGYFCFVRGGTKYNFHITGSWNRPSWLNDVVMEFILNYCRSWYLWLFLQFKNCVSLLSWELLSFLNITKLYSPFASLPWTTCVLLIHGTITCILGRPKCKAFQ